MYMYMYMYMYTFLSISTLLGVMEIHVGGSGYKTTTQQQSRKCLFCLFL